MSVERYQKSITRENWLTKFHALAKRSGSNEAGCRRYDAGKIRLETGEKIKMYNANVRTVTIKNADAFFVFEDLNYINNITGASLFCTIALGIKHHGCPRAACTRLRQRPARILPMDVQSPPPWLLVYRTPAGAWGSKVVRYRYSSART